MNGFDSSVWKPLGLGLLAGGLVGCSEKPAGTQAAPAPLPAYVEARSTGAGGPAPGTSRDPLTEIPATPMPAAIPTGDALIDAVSLAAWNELLKPDLSPEAWETASKTLLDRPAEAESLLIRELGSDDPYRRETAATLLGQSGVPSEKAQPALLRCLADDSPFVRANAAAALASVRLPKEPPTDRLAAHAMRAHQACRLVNR